MALAGRSSRTSWLLTGAPQEEIAAPGRPLDQNFVRLADPRHVLSAHIRPNHLDEPVESLGSHLIRNVILEPDCRGTFTNRVFEGVGIVKVGFGDQPQGRLELLLGLAGKPNDDIG